MDIQIASAKFYDHSLHIKGFSPNTIRRYRCVIYSFIRAMKIERVDQITNEQIQSFFFLGRTKRHWTVNTFIIYHCTLSVFLQWCMAHHYLSDNPIKTLE